MSIQKNVQTVLYFFLWNTDGTENTTGTPTVEVAKDSGSFASTTNSAVRTGSTGLFYVTITNTELNCDRLCLKATLTGCVPVADIYYPEADYTSTVAGRIDAAVSSRSTYAGGDTAGTTTLLARIASALTITSGKVDVNDKTGFGLSSGGIQAIWDAAVSAFTTAGSIGKRIVDNLTGDAFTRLGAPVGATTAADIATLQADTDNIQTRLPAALQSGRMVSVVGAMDTDVITSGAVAATAVTEIQAGLSTLTQADIRTAVGLASANLDTQLSTIDDFLDTEIAAIKAKTDNLPASPASTTNITAGTITTVTNLTNAPTTGDLTATMKTSIANAVWNEVQSGHTTAGTFGKFLDAAISGISGGGGSGPSAATIAAAVCDELLSGHTTAGSVGKALADLLTLSAAIKAKTDGLPSDPADASDLAALLSAIAGYIDTEVASILADTTNIKTRIPAALVSGRMDSSVGAMAADVISASAIATDAIGSAEIAASAVTKIQSGLATATELAATKAIAQAAATAAGQLG